MTTVFEEDPRRKALGYEFAETPTINRDAIRRRVLDYMADPMMGEAWHRWSEGQVLALLDALDTAENFHKNCLCQRVQAEFIVDGRHSFWIDGIEYEPVVSE